MPPPQRIVIDVRKDYKFAYDHDFTFDELDQLEERLQEFNYALVQLEEEVKAEKPNLNILKEYRNRMDDFREKLEVLNREKADQDNIRGEYMDLKRMRHD